MKRYKIFNLSKDIILLENVSIAKSFFSRLKGLLGKTDLSEGEGIVIKPCNAIHTMGMKFPIDVAFIDKNNEVIKVIREIPPGKFSPIVKKSVYVIESRENEFNERRLSIGDKLEIKGIQSFGEQ